MFQFTVLRKTLNQNPVKVPISTVADTADLTSIRQTADWKKRTAGKKRTAASKD